MGFPSDAVFGLGTQLQVGDGESPENFTTICEVRSLDGPTLTTDILDVTNHCSQGGVREFKAGLIDPGEISFEMAYVPGDPAHEQLLSDQVARRIRNYRIVWPVNIRTFGFQGIITGLPFTFPIDEVVTASVTVKLTGLPNFDVFDQA